MLLNIEMAKVKRGLSPLVGLCLHSLTCAQYPSSMGTLPHSSAGNWLQLLGGL